MAAPSLISSLLGEGWIGPVHCDGREILRRIFVTVRDCNWQEVRPMQFHSVVDERARSVRLSARHTSDRVDFEWQGELTVSQDGRELNFAFKAQAMRDMHVCRLGLIVLHPVDSMVGSRVTASSDQVEQTFTIDQQLAPQPIIGGVPGAMTEPFTELLIEREDWGQLLLSFEGDSFELEDQRNWGDASFKTYCTPLRKGFPRQVTKGTVVAHSVKVSFIPPKDDAPTITSAVDTKIQAKSQQHFPQIGRMSAGLSPNSRDGSGAWDHLHVDLTDKDPSALRSALESSSSQIEIAVDAKSLDQGVLEWVSFLRAHRERIARMILYGPGTSLPSELAITLWHSLLHAAEEQSIPVFAGTRGYFVEFNRAAPFVAPVKGIAFPLTATVHSDDPETLMSNVATVRDMGETGRRLTQASEIALAPLALYYPPSTYPAKLSSDVVLNWLTSTIRHAVDAGVSSITLADDVANVLELEFGVSTADELRHLIATQRECLPGAGLAR